MKNKGRISLPFLYVFDYSITFCVLKISSMAVIAVSSSSPSQVMVISDCVGIPSDITPIMDFMFTDLSLKETLTSHLNLLAAFTATVAGRACKPTGSITNTLISFVSVLLFYWIYNIYHIYYINESALIQVKAL